MLDGKALTIFDLSPIDHLEMVEGFNGREKFYNFPKAKMTTKFFFEMTKFFVKPCETSCVALSHENLPTSKSK